MATLQGVEIFAPGHWFPGNGPKNGITITKDYVVKLLDNTKKLLSKKLINPILKIGHTTERVADGKSSGVPLFGSAENFRMKGEKIIADFIGIPELLVKAFKQKRLTNISVEIIKDKFGLYINAIALLGTDKPAVESLKDLETFLSTGKSNGIPDIVFSSDDSEFYYTVKPVDDFQVDSFKTKELDGVQVKFGQLNSSAGAEEIQSYHFGNTEWNQQTAEKWIIDHVNFSKKGESEEIIFEFSEPSFLNDFFQQPVNKRENMGDENKVISAEQYAQALADYKELQFKFSAKDEKISELENKIDALIAGSEQEESEEMATKFSEAQAQVESLTAEKAEVNQKLEKAEEKLVAFAEKEKEILFAAKKIEIMTPYKADVKAGLLPPSIVKDIETHLEAQKIDFSEKKELSVSIELAGKIGKAYANRLPDGEQSEDEDGVEDGAIKFTNASDELDFEIAKLRGKNPNLDYEQSVEMVFKMKPALEKKYQEFSMAG